MSAAEFQRRGQRVVYHSAGPAVQIPANLNASTMMIADKNGHITMPDLPGIGFEGKSDLCAEMNALASWHAAIPGPAKQEPQMCNCASEVWSFGLSRNDDVWVGLLRRPHMFFSTSVHRDRPEVTGGR
jgi:hypothetical protein